MDIWESYIHAYNKHIRLIPEKYNPDHNPMYDLVQIPHDTYTLSGTSLTTRRATHKHPHPGTPTTEGPRTH
jgi:hypothetical protein